MSFLETHCTFTTLREIDLLDRKPFVCSDQDLDEFFQKDFIKYSEELFGKTYCFTLDQNPTIIVCAFTIANDSIKARLLPRSEKNKISRKVTNVKRGLKSYPAVLIGRLGVGVGFLRKGIGGELMDFIKAWFIDENNKTGCRFIVVDSYNLEGPLHYYLKNGFQFLFDDEENEKKYSAINTEGKLETRLLYFDLIHLRSSK